MWEVGGEGGNGKCESEHWMNKKLCLFYDFLIKFECYDWIIKFSLKNSNFYKDCNVLGTKVPGSNKVLT